MNRWIAVIAIPAAGGVAVAVRVREPFVPDPIAVVVQSVADLQGPGVHRRPGVVAIPPTGGESVPVIVGIDGIRSVSAAVDTEGVTSPDDHEAACPNGRVVETRVGSA